jgi:hypothetical protein
LNKGKLIDLTTKLNEKAVARIKVQPSESLLVPKFNPKKRKVRIDYSVGALEEDEKVEIQTFEEYEAYME